MDELVEEKLIVLQQRVWPVMVTWFSTLAFCNCVIVMFRAVMLGYVPALTTAQCAIFLLLYMVFLVLLWHPGLFKNRFTTQCLYFAGMLHASLFVGPGMSSSSILLPAAMGIIPMIDLLSAFVFNIKHVVMWQIVFNASFATSCQMSSLDEETRTSAMIVIFLHTTLTITGVQWVESLLRRTIRSEMEAQGLREKQLAKNALLHIFYDVVVELDADLKVAGDCKDLSAMIPGHAPLTREAPRMEDFLPFEEDRNTFSQRLCQEPADDDPIAGVMHLSMRSGGFGDCLSVELFHYQFRGLTGRLQYLVGIRELSDAAGDDNTTAIDNGDTGAVWATVNFGNPSLPIQECSPVFHRLIGVLDDDPCMTKIISKQGADGLAAWMQFVIGDQGTEEQANSHSVKFRPPSHPRQRIHARCRVDFYHAPELKDGDLHVRLCFFEVQRVHVFREPKMVRHRHSDGRGDEARGTPASVEMKHSGSLPPPQPLGTTIPNVKHSGSLPPPQPLGTTIPNVKHTSSVPPPQPCGTTFLNL